MIVRFKVFWIILSLILLTIIGYGTYYHYETINSIKRNHNQFIDAINDTVLQYKNEKGELVSRISTIQMDNYKDFINMKFKDSVIIELQSKVSYYKDKAESVTNFNVVGNVSGSSLNKIDTIYVDTIQVKTVYSSQFFDPWIRLNTKTMIDSTLFDLSYNDTYTVTQLNDKDGIYVEIINQSPYVKVDNIRTFRIKTPIYEPKRWGIGVQIGYGINHIDNKFQTSPYIGIGVSYNLFNF